MRLDAAVGRKRFVFQFGVVDKLGFIDQQPRERKRVRAAWSVLADDYSHRAVVERYDVFIVFRVDDWLPEGLRRFPPHDIMDSLDEAPSLPSGEQAGDCVGQSVLNGSNTDITLLLKYLDMWDLGGNFAAENLKSDEESCNIFPCFYSRAGLYFADC